MKFVRSTVGFAIAGMFVMSIWATGQELTESRWLVCSFSNHRTNVVHEPLHWCY